MLFILKSSQNIKIFFSFATFMPKLKVLDMFLCQNMNGEMIERTNERRKIQTLTGFSVYKYVTVPHIQLIRDSFNFSHIH